MPVTLPEHPTFGWIDELNPLGPPADDLNNTPISAEALEAAVGLAYDYSDQVVNVVPGALGDGSNETSLIQSRINAVALLGGGVIDGLGRTYGINPLVGLELKDNVILVNFTFLLKGAYPYATNGKIIGNFDRVNGNPRCGVINCTIDGQGMKSYTSVGDMTSGTNVFHPNDSVVTGAEEGMPFVVEGAGVAGAKLSSTITSVGASTITLAANASTTATDQNAYFDQSEGLNVTAISVAGCADARFDVIIKDFPGGGFHPQDCARLFATYQGQDVQRGQVVPKGDCSGFIWVKQAWGPDGADDLVALNASDPDHYPNQLHVHLGPANQGEWLISGGNEAIVTRGAHRCVITGGPVRGGKDGNVVNEDQRGDTLTITGASNPGLIEITTSVAHGMETGWRVYITGVLGNTAANGLWTITKTSTTKFTLDGSTASGARTGGGTARWFLSSQNCYVELSCYDAGRGSLAAHGLSFASTESAGMVYALEVDSPGGAGALLEVQQGGEIEVHLRGSISDTGRVDTAMGGLRFHAPDGGKINGSFVGTMARTAGGYVQQASTLSGGNFTLFLTGTDANYAGQGSEDAVKVDGQDMGIAFYRSRRTGNFASNAVGTAKPRNALRIVSGSATYDSLDVKSADFSGSLLSGSGSTPGVVNYGTATLPITESDVTGLVTDLAGKQPLDSDLTAIAALSTTSYGRAFLALADAAAGRTALGLGSSATHATTDYDAAGAAAAAQAASQPLDSDLTALAALTTDSFGRALLTKTSAADIRTYLALVIGTDVQAHDADLDAVAALATDSFGLALLTKSSAAAIKTYLALTIGTDVEAWDADLDALAALSSTGIAVRSAANTWVQRSVAAGTGISVTNGDGASGNPTVAADLSVVAQLNAYHHFISAHGRTTTAGVASTNYQIASSSADAAGTAMNSIGASNIRQFASADWLATGRTLKMMCRYRVAIGSSAATMNWTIQVATVTVASGAYVYTQVAASAATISSPGTNSFNASQVTDFTPPSDGQLSVYYTLSTTANVNAGPGADILLRSV